MTPARRNPDLTGLWDTLLGLGAAAYLAGFVAAIEVALGRLAY